MTIRGTDAVASEVGNVTSWSAILQGRNSSEIEEWLATYGGTPGVDIEAWARTNPSGSLIYHASEYGVGEDSMYTLSLLT